MSDDVLKVMVEAIDARRVVAMVTVTEATGAARSALGRRLVVPAAGQEPVTGSLELPPQYASLAEQCVARVRDVMENPVAGPALIRLSALDVSVTVFVDVQAPPQHLIICGAGHIAAPLAAMARLCDFDVTVIDDRVQYASRDRFPTATRVEVGPFRQTLRALRENAPFDRRTFLVLVTRGHQHDVDCLLEVIDDPLAYIGMIGSRRRIRAVFELLKGEAGIPAERFDGIFAPVGLDIGAHTPAEIAVAIVGEMINVARAGRGVSLREGLRRNRVEN